MDKKYRSYVLVAKNEHELIEIDWTKIEEYKGLKKEKYKLQQIDFFTSHFMDQQELISCLLECNLLSIEQLRKIRLWIYPATQNTVTEIIDGKKRRVSSPLYAPNHLPYGPMYQKHTPFLDDYYMIPLLQSKLTDLSFITKLYNKYVTEGNYSDRAIGSLKAKIDSTKQALTHPHTMEEKERYERILKSYWHQYYDLKEMNSLLNSIRNYTLSVHQGVIVSKELEESVRNNICEFFLRTKYTVLSCQDGIYDNRKLEFKMDKSQKREVKYLALHEFILFIQKCLEEEQENKVEEPRKKIYRKQKNEIEGQLSFWDLFEQ